MALNAETLKANEVLSTLSDEQIKQIETLSLNDENAVIGAKTREIYEGLDKDLEEISGMKKGGKEEKTYAFAKRVVGEFKTKAESSSELNKTVEDLTTKVKDYEKQIAEGSTDATLKQKLTDTETALGLAKEEAKKAKEELGKKDSEFSEKLTSLEVNSAFSNAKASLKFKSDYPEKVQNVLLDSAKSKILETYKTDFVEEDGKKTMVFRDSEDKIALNAANGLSPFTLNELLKAELKDSLDLGASASGGGTKPPGAPANIGLADVVKAETQVEADTLIEKHLLQKGFTKRGTFEDSEKFQNEFQKIRQDSKVSELPME